MGTPECPLLAFGVVRQFAFDAAHKLALSVASFLAFHVEPASWNITMLNSLRGESFGDILDTREVAE